MKLTELEIEMEAMKLFAIVHGKGDTGSSKAFWCQNADDIRGWLKLARYVKELQLVACKPA